LVRHGADATYMSSTGGGVTGEVSGLVGFDPLASGGWADESGTGSSAETTRRFW
jgi:hypothetical protein